MHQDETFIRDFKEVPAPAPQSSAVEPSQYLADLIRTIRLPNGSVVTIDAAAAIAAALASHVEVLRDIVIAGEHAGWDIDNGELLNAGRAAVAALLGPQG